MIGSIRGIILHKAPPCIVVEAHGVGYELQAPMTTFYQLPAEQQPVLLWTHLAIREDAHQLYGFIERQDRELFRQLIKVNGVGPKLALGILSSIERQAFLTAVQQQASEVLVNLPGIGKKTAERLLIECKDLLKHWLDAPQVNTALATAPGSVQDAIDALASLGYKPQIAKQAVEKIYQDGQPVEMLIRKALQQMVRS